MSFPNVFSVRTRDDERLAYRGLANRNTVSIPLLSILVFPGFLLVLPGVIAYASWQIIPRMLKKYKFKRGNAEYQRERRKKQ